MRIALRKDSVTAGVIASLLVILPSSAKRNWIGDGTCKPTEHHQTRTRSRRP